jgi:hypothetical protein
MLRSTAVALHLQTVRVYSVDSIHINIASPSCRTSCVGVDCCVAGLAGRMLHSSEVALPLQTVRVYSFDSTHSASYLLPRQLHWSSLFA